MMERAQTYAMKASSTRSTNGSFTRKVEYKVENAVRYIATIGAEETERPFLKGKEVLDQLSKQPEFSKILNSVLTLQTSGTDNFLIVTKSQNECRRLVSSVSHVMIKGVKFQAEPGATDVFEYKPRNLKVMIYDAPLTTTDESIISRLKSYGDIIDNKVYWEMYAPPFTHVQTGSRFVFMRNVAPKEGLPTSINISNNRIKIRHSGQVRDPAKRAEMRSQYQRGIYKEAATDTGVNADPTTKSHEGLNSLTADESERPSERNNPAEYPPPSIAPQKQRYKKHTHIREITCVSLHWMGATSCQVDTLLKICPKQQLPMDNQETNH
jgi:hypothetical protein